MEIVPYQPDYLPALTNLYNELIRSVPHCYLIETGELADAFAGIYGYESFNTPMAREQVFITIDPEVTGFVHVGEASRDDHYEQGIIRFLAYPRGRRDVGQRLLEQAELWFQTCHLESVLVYPQAYRYPFYHLSHAYLSNHLEHIQALLLFNDYEVRRSEVFLDWPDMDPDPLVEVTGLDIDVRIKKEPGQGRLPDLKLKAYHEGQEIGECVSLSAGTFSNQEAAEDWIFTQWLSISEPYQGKGLGRFLLGSVLSEARKIGYRHAAISTALDNHRALLFYANCGYHAIDWTKEFYRTLPKNN